MCIYTYVVALQPSMVLRDPYISCRSLKAQRLLIPTEQKV